MHKRCLALTITALSIVGTLATSASATPDAGYTPETFDDIASGEGLHLGHAGVLRLYWAYFDREPEPGGARFWVDQYTAGTWTFGAISDFFASSSEFVATYGSVSDERFLELMYANVLDRAPDEGGFEFWAGRLVAGQSRGSVMADFSWSPEFRDGHRLPSDARANTGPATPPALPLCNEMALAASGFVPNAELGYSYSTVSTAQATLGSARPGCERLWTARVCGDSVDEVWVNGTIYEQPSGGIILPFWPDEIRYKRVISIRHERGCRTVQGAPIADFSYRVDYELGSGARCVDFSTGVATFAPDSDAPRCYLAGQLGECGALHLGLVDQPDANNFLYEISEQASTPACARVETELAQAGCELSRVDLAEGNASVGQLDYHVSYSPAQINSSDTLRVDKTWTCGATYRVMRWSSLSA